MGPVVRRLSYANVISTLALFIALGGGAYAVTTLPPKSVGSKQLKNGAVTPKKVASATVKLFKGQKGDQGPQGLQGVQGLQGIQGLQGDKGDKGADGTALAYAEVVNNTVVAANSKNFTQANLGTPSDGFYCIHDLPFTPHNAVVTLEAGGTFTVRLANQIMSGGPCTVIPQAEIDTSPGNKNFMILLN